MAIASKDRTGLFIDRDPFVITEATGNEIAIWNESGIDPEIEREKHRNDLFSILEESVKSAEDLPALKEAFEHAKSVSKEIGQERFDKIAEMVKGKKSELEATTDETSSNSSASATHEK